MKKFSQHHGFSILMALGITAILMIVVTGLAVMYSKELKISRLTYDEVLAQASAEWMFEYGMLKIRNHADGFEDSVFLKNNPTETDKDAEMFRLKTPRSQGLEVNYEMKTQTESYSGTLEKDGFLVLPLGVGYDDIISNKSRKPEKNSNITYISGLEITGIDGNVSWTIVASKNNESVGLQGTGAINAGTKWDLQLWDQHYICVNSSGVWNSCNKTQYDSHIWEKEIIDYSYKIRGKVQDFLAMQNDGNTFGELAIGVDESGNEKITSTTETQKEKNVKYENFYLILYNNSNSDKNIIIKPKPGEKIPLIEYNITATAKKWNASQIFRFSENRAGVYDILKFGYYDPLN